MRIRIMDRLRAYRLRPNHNSRTWAWLANIRLVFSICFILVTVLANLAVSSETEANSKETPAISKSTKPNVLIILADDLGFSDLGCYGGEIATPNLDSVAASGLQFTQFYNTARCWPTRGSLMTGYYAQQIRRDSLPGVPSGGGNRGIRPDWAVLVPNLLKPAGYRSYHTGKWHIDGMPIENGFDRSYFLKDQGRFFNPTKHWKDDVKLPAVEKSTDFYATTALCDHVIEVLEEHGEQHSDKPFFHYLAFSAPHFPLHALPEDIAIYEDTYTDGWQATRAKRWKKLAQKGLNRLLPTTTLSRVERDLGPPYHFPKALDILGAGEVNKPLAWGQLNDQQKRFQSKKMSIHAAMIHRMDIEIGRVFEQIKKMGQWENTLIVFLSDNGASAEIMVRDDGHDADAMPGSAATYLCLGPGWSTTCNTPFRRHKTWTHEGGISTPLLMSWPQGIEARGEIRRAPGHVIDIVPTVLELAGAKTLENAPPAPGKSLVPVFAKDKDDFAGDNSTKHNSNKHESIWWFHDGHKAIRMGDWKAVAPIGEPWELYDLSKDRGETLNLAIPKSGTLKELVAQWQKQHDEYVELASRDISKEVLARAKRSKRKSGAMGKAQADDKPKRAQVLLSGESFMVNGRHAFLMSPKTQAGDGQPEEANSDATEKPWIFYAPTLPAYPDKAESWMHQQFLDAGVAVAGIDVGEAYGSPHAIPYFVSLYDEMVRRGYSKKPALFGRSRGGLWVSSWALAHPERVAGIGGIYPVYDYTTYPGVERAATAYDSDADGLLANQQQLNPIKRAVELAEAKIPVWIIHGKDDKVVSLADNSLALKQAYQSNSAGDLITLVEIEGQGHNFWPGFFNCQELVDFLIEKAKGAQVLAK